MMLKHNSYFLNVCWKWCRVDTLPVFVSTLVLKLIFIACVTVQAACPALTTGGCYCSVQATCLMFDTCVAYVTLFL